MSIFTIEIESVLPGPMSMARRAQYQLANIVADDCNQALAEYKKIMENQLPKGHCYGLKVVDNNGVEYNKGSNLWDRQKD